MVSNISVRCSFRTTGCCAFRSELARSSEDLAAQKFALPMNLLSFTREERDMNSVLMMLKHLYGR